MAILLDPFPQYECVKGHKKAKLYTRLVKTEQTRHGVTGWTSTAQKKRVPCNRRSALQIGSRAMVDFASQMWWTLDEEELGTWKILSANYGLEWFPTYLASLLYHWHHGRGPARFHTTYPNQTPIGVLSASAVGGRGCATLFVSPSSSLDLYGLVILRSPIEIIDPSFSMAIKLIPTTSLSSLSYCDNPITPGTWHYRAMFFTTEGTSGPFCPDFSVSVS